MSTHFFVCMDFLPITSIFSTPFAISPEKPEAANPDIRCIFHYLEVCIVLHLLFGYFCGNLH